MEVVQAFGMPHAEVATLRETGDEPLDDHLPRFLPEVHEYVAAEHEIEPLERGKGIADEIQALEFHQPTHGIRDHRREAIEFFKTFPDQHLDNRPYKVFFASGDWTCSIARFRGTMKGPMKGPDGKEIPPTGKSFDVEFCTVARWDNGQIVEENLFYDLVTFMKQIGLSK